MHHAFLLTDINLILEFAEPPPQEREILPHWRRWAKLHTQLSPYLMAAARQYVDRGMPVMRHMCLVRPSIRRSDQYLFGADLLVAPVTAQGATERKLYLPEGDWYDFWTDDKQTGKREMTRSVDLGTLPLFVRAGAILPLDPVRQYTAQATDEATLLRLWKEKRGESEVTDE